MIPPSLFLGPVSTGKFVIAIILAILLGMYIFSWMM